MVIAHYYHVWASGAWAPPCNEHHDALVRSGMHVFPRVGVTGEPRDRDVFRDWAHRHGWDIIYEQDQGYEQTTLSAVRDWALRNDPTDTVLYCHAKGARHDLAGTNTRWRQAMTDRLVGEWRPIQQILTHHDAVGCCWRNKAEFPLMDPDWTGTGIFMGNFWWATARYIATLPEPPVSTPGDAEGWTGLNNPDVIDMLPWWVLYRIGDGTWKYGSLDQPWTEYLKTNPRPAPG